MISVMDNEILQVLCFSLYHLHISIILLCYLLNNQLRTSTVAGKLDYRVTEESLMDRLGTNMHEACLQIDKDCRLMEKLFDLYSFYF